MPMVEGQLIIQVIYYVNKPFRLRSCCVQICEGGMALRSCSSLKNDWLLKYLIKR
jgi:hypothetical protein